MRKAPKEVSQKRIPLFRAIALVRAFNKAKSGKIAHIVRAVEKAHAFDKDFKTHQLGILPASSTVSRKLIWVSETLKNLKPATLKEKAVCMVFCKMPLKSEPRKWKMRFNMFLPIANFLRRMNNFVYLGEGKLLEVRGVGKWHICGTDTLQRRIEIVKGMLAYKGCNL